MERERERERGKDPWVEIEIEIEVEGERNDMAGLLYIQNWKIGYYSSRVE